MNKNRKNLHKAAVNVLGLTIASVMAAGTVAEVAAPLPVFAAQTQKKESGKTIYLNGTAKASKTADGKTKENAVSSFGKALELAGAQGEIIISGTVTIDSEIKLAIPSGVTIKKEKDFKGKMVKLTGKGKLILTGSGITAEDVDVTGAEAGTEAFQINKKEEKPETEPQETGKEENPTEDSKPEAPSEEVKPETEAPKEELPKEEIPKEETPKTEEQTPKTEVQPEAPKQEEEKKEPEQQPEQPQQQPQEEKITLEIPEKVVLKTVKDWKAFDFTEAGFVGNGTFAWEEEKEPEKYETERNIRFIPDKTEEDAYSKLPGWNSETKAIVRSVKIQVEELKETEQQENSQTQKPEEKPEEEQKQDQVTDTKPEEEKQEQEESKKPEKEDEETEEESVTEEKSEQESSDEEQKEESTEKKEEVIIIPVDPNAAEEEAEEVPEQENEETEKRAQPGKLGEVTEEIPESIPVGSLIDESGVQVFADFLPFYVDLQVTYNEAVHELPDAGIGEILSAYELKLWDLKEDTEYKIPEGKKVKVMIPLPENADCYSDLAIAHYLGNNQYEYFIFDKEGKIGNMTVEVKDGAEYLAFETASFSPFNVGGHQIVGPGTSSSGHKAPVGGNSTGNTGTGTGTGNQTNSSGSAGGSSQTSGTTSSQKKPAQSTTAGSNTGTKVIYTVKTGDGTEIARYVLLGAGALALGAGAAVAGKKKKESK